MSFKTFLLNEKLSLSSAKRYAKNWDKTRYSEWFGGKYRIYLPLKKKMDDKFELPIPNNVNSVLYYEGFEVVDYGNGLAKKTDGDDKRVFKIGSILQKAMKKFEADNYYKEAYQKFISDPVRRTSRLQTAIVAISRHPYDIAGMSTDRGWTSCMDLKSGSLSKFCAYDIKEGSLIAYLINADDKNINYPIGRFLIKPFINDNEEVYLVPERKVYGTTVPGFKEAVQDWIDEKQEGLFGTFDKHPRLYDDDSIDSIAINYDKIKDMIKGLDGGLTLAELGKNFPHIDQCKFSGTFTKLKDQGYYVGFTGEWYDGNFKGIFLAGTFKNGIFQDGVFNGGTFENGIFKPGARFKNGTFKGGIFSLGDGGYSAWPETAKWVGGKFSADIRGIEYTFPTKVNPKEGSKVVKESLTLVNNIFDTINNPLSGTYNNSHYGKDDIQHWLDNLPGLEDTIFDLEDNLTFRKQLYQYGFNNGPEVIEAINIKLKSYIENNEL